MPLPDADKRSPRVYTNLQNLDLANVTFSNVETTGDPIAIEEANEDELRRLVLVNLARLTCAGEWNGLLTAGGGGNEFNAEFPTVWGAYRYIVSEIPPWGNLDSAGGSQTVSTFAKPFAFPFLSPVSGDVSEVGIYLKTSDQADLQIAIYSDDGGLPDSRMCYASIDMSSGNGTLYQTSITGTATLVRGTQYWFSMNSDADPGTSALYASRYEYIPGMGVGNDVNGTPSAIKDNAGDDYDLPAATFTSSYAYNSVDRPAFSIKVS